MSRVVVDNEALWSLLELAGGHPDPTLRAAANALIKKDRTTAPPRRTHLSPQETAELLGVSITTIYRRVADGSMPHERLGRLVRIPTSVVSSGPKSPGVATAQASPAPVPDTVNNDQERAA